MRAAMPSHGGLEPWWWDLSEVCDGESPGGAPAKLGNVSLAWNPRKVLQAIYGARADAADSTCHNWARGRGQESMQEAVSAAAEWAILYHHGYSSYDAYVKAGRAVYMRHGQSVSVKPGNYVRESVANALRDATRREGLDAWRYAEKGERCPECDGKGKPDGIECETCNGAGKLSKRKWVHAYRVEFVTPAEDEDGHSRETELDDPALRPPQEDADDPYYQERRRTLRLMLDTFLAQWAETDPLGADAFRAVHLNERKLADVAADHNVNRSTAKRRADRPYNEVVRQLRQGRLLWQRGILPGHAEDAGSGSSGGIHYEGQWPPSVLDGVLAA
jgi:hypothetical protein